MTKVYCIIVTYNAEPWIEQCLSSIDEELLRLEIIVIDNCSKDNTVEIIKENFPKVRVVVNDYNMGFGGANNIGYEIAKADNAEYIYLLNQDTISYKNTIYNLIEIDKRSNDNLGVVSPIHLNAEGNKLDSDFEKYITANTCKNYISDITLNNIKPYYEIGFINAAAWLLKVETVDYLGGLFSSAFFHYGEDTNFIGRIRYFHYKVVIVPKIFIHHCREERVLGISKDFESKTVDIYKVTIMHDITSSYGKCMVNLYRYSIQRLMKKDIKGFIKLLTYPLFQMLKIKKFRKTYIYRRLEKSK